ncbi:glycosyltransferase family 2 protein [Candidatus Kapabacteria bacterium]|nr:glycosyltransferase family 2 protein [Candidatus Kapabacteria bacterium]
MKISVITPSYNQGNFISETIESVLNQNWDNLEYIIMDGGSTDNTLEIIKKYDKDNPNKIIWKSEKDRGQSHAINKGFELATGDIVCWLNSDDYFPKDTLKKVAAKFEDNPNSKWLTGDYIIIDANGNEIQNFVKKYKNLLKLLPKKLTLSIANYVNQPSTFWRKDIIDEIGLINEDLNYTMDYEYWIRIIQKYDPLIVKDALSVFRIHGESKGGDQFEKQFKEEYQVAKNNNVGILPLLLHSIHNKLIIAAYKFLK